MGNISLSRYKDTIPIVWHKGKILIDIERIDEKVKKIKSKFLSEDEELVVGENLKKLVEYWSMKETAYKVGGNTIPLKSLEIKNSLENLYSCSIHGKTIEIMTEEINGHILSYTT